jgi:2-iminobutanoate/2-iminopropanoate deaminase
MALERFDPFDGALGFSLGVRAGSVVHVAGMVGVNADDLSVPDGIEDQMRLAYKNIGDVLEHFGCRFEDIANQTVFFVGDHAAATAAAAAVRPDFGAALPASAMVGVERLVDSRFLVEVQVVAHLPG